MTRTPEIILGDSLLTWLAQVNNLTAGVDIFGGMFPAKPSVDIVTNVQDTSGAARGYSRYVNTSHQIITRGKGHDATSTRAWAIYNSLFADALPLRNFNLSDDWFLLSIDAIQPPYDLGISEGGLYLFTFNIQCRGTRRAITT